MVGWAASADVHARRSTIQSENDVVTLTERFDDLLEENLLLRRACQRGVSRRRPALSPHRYCGKLRVQTREPQLRIAILGALLVCGLFFGTCARSASAAVLDAETSGFTTVNEATIDASRATVWQAAVAEIDRWWSSAHTISGEAGRLHIDARPQGCFCENLGEDSGVVHLTVTMVNPTVVLRLSGGLGPLGLMGVNGNMTWEFFDVEDRTRVRFTYAVGGYRPGGLDSIAEPVDGVIGEALLRLKAYVETGDAERLDLE